MPWVTAFLDLPADRHVDATTFWLAVSAHRSVVDQLSIDVPAAGYEQECAFWAGLLGREVVPSDRHEEFRFLPGSPLRILLQRLKEPTGPTRAHLDLATDDREAGVSRHEAPGARVVRRATRWTVLVDPAGLDYCVTARDPR